MLLKNQPCLIKNVTAALWITWQPLQAGAPAGYRIVSHFQCENI
ncbi:hypothetical protein CAter10_1973 [Collimonas arenae]|nr:hypothetical protein CAter10_1973 [Collimonas arenae]